MDDETLRMVNPNTNTDEHTIELSEEQTERKYEGFFLYLYIFRVGVSCLSICFLNILVQSKTDVKEEYVLGKGKKKNYKSKRMNSLILWLRLNLGWI